MVKARLRQAVLVCAALLIVSEPCFGSSNKNRDDQETARQNDQQTGGEAAEQSATTASNDIISAPFVLDDLEEVAEETVEPEGSLQGKVIDHRGDPVEGAKVWCIDSTGRVFASVESDQEGRYSFTGLRPGTYRVEARYDGFSTPLKIGFGEEQEAGPPAVPRGVEITEIENRYDQAVRVKVSWNIVPGATAYKCELMRSGTREPLTSYPDMKQTFCEFGGLTQNTEYEARVFARNEQGYSKTYALNRFTTSDLAPPSPFGLGVLSVLNHRAELLWKGEYVEDLNGYYLQVREGNGEYRYFSSVTGLTSSRSQATVIPPEAGTDAVEMVLAKTAQGEHVLRNGIPYDFRVFAVDNGGNVSAPSTPLQDVVLEDTVPPSVPYDISYTFVAADRIRVSWKTRDSDVQKYRIYYGVEEDRLDGVAYTVKTHHDIIVDRELLKGRQLYVTVTAIDHAGNESGYRPVGTEAVVSDRGEVTRDIVLSAENLYRDYSLAIREPSGKVQEAKKRSKPKPKLKPPVNYGHSYLKKKGYVIEKGETATLSGEIMVPENILIKVQAGGTLIIKDASIGPESGLWGGIRFQSGAEGRVESILLRRAATGIGVVSNRNGVVLRDTIIEECGEYGILIKDASVEMDLLTVRNNPTGVFIQNGSVTVTNSLFESNQKGLLADNYQTNLQGCRFTSNTQYGLRLYGGAKVKNCIIESNRTGVVIEEGRGEALLENSAVRGNTIDGLVLGATAAVVKHNVIADNGRNGIYIKSGANPVIAENDIVNNMQYAVVGGGKISRCFVAYNNGSIYIDETEERGVPDQVLSSSSSGVIKQILNVDYIENLTRDPVVQ